MFLCDPADKVADKAVVMEFGPVLQLRQGLQDILSAHNLTSESVDSIVAHSLATVLVKNFCIAAQEANKHPCLSLSNSTIAEVKYRVDPFCTWFINTTGLVDKLYKVVPGGDMFVSIRATGARIVFIVSVGQQRTY